MSIGNNHSILTAKVVPPPIEQLPPTSIDDLVASQSGFLGGDRMSRFMRNTNVLEVNLDAVKTYWDIDLRDGSFADPDLDIPTAISSSNVHREQRDLLEGIVGLRTLCEEDAQWLQGAVEPLLGEAVYFVGSYVRDNMRLGDRQLRSRTNPNQPVYGEGVLERVTMERLASIKASRASAVLELSGVKHHGGEQIEFVMNTDRVYVSTQREFLGTHLFGHPDEAEAVALYNYDNCFEGMEE